MDGMLADKMKDLLADPDAMARVMDLAGKLFSGQEGGGQSAPTLHEEEPQKEERAEEKEKPALHTQALPAGLFSGGGGDDDRIRLIRALCPYLNPQRREAAMALMRILKLISLADASGIFKSIL